METNNHRHISFGGKIAILFVAVFASIILASILSGILIGTHLLNMDNPIHMKIMQLITSIYGFLLPAYVCNYYFYNESSIMPKKQASFNIKTIGLTVLLVLFSAPLIALITYLNSKIPLPELFRNSEEQAAKTMERLLTVKSVWGLLGNLLVIAVAPAIVEEYLFRGVFLKIFLEKKINTHLSIWIVAAVFSLVHLQMSGFFPRMILGAGLGYLMVWSDSLKLPIIAHFTNNAMAVLLYYFGAKDIDNLDKFSTQQMQIWGVLIVISLFVVIFMLKKLRLQLKEKSVEEIV